MITSYTFIECSPTSFKSKKGDTVDGYFIYILERVVKNNHIYYNTIRQWSNVCCYLEFGAALDCVFDSRGKLISYSERGDI